MSILRSEARDRARSYIRSSKGRGESASREIRWGWFTNIKRKATTSRFGRSMCNSSISRICRSRPLRPRKPPFAGGRSTSTLPLPITASATRLTARVNGPTMCICRATRHLTSVAIIFSARSSTPVASPATSAVCQVPGGLMAYSPARNVTVAAVPSACSWCRVIVPAVQSTTS